jgi:hypothetical protein
MNSFKIACPAGVISGLLHTKEKRHELYGIVAGGSGSTKPEEYQRSQIEIGTGIPCLKTHMRINWRTNEMHGNPQPMKNINGFDYTENFDGLQQFTDKTVWINLKSVVGAGGSQTRTLRDECYHFVNAQLEYLLKTQNEPNYYFANIFDGDEAAKRLDKFNYLLALPNYTSVKKYIYVGDLMSYFDWLNSTVNAEQ